MKPFFLSDEEHGKKYDDRKPSKIPGLRAPHWHPARLPPRRTLRRTLLLAIVVGLCVYVFVKNIPDDLPIRDRRRPVYADHGAPGSFRPQKPAVTLPQRQPKKNAHEPSSVSTALYSGPLKFTKLAKTLHGISEFTKGSFPINRNVLFAASNPRSAATLLPLACAMGREMRSLIHFALMGSTKITLQELRDINGLDDSCQIHYHGTTSPWFSTFGQAYWETDRQV